MVTTKGATPTKFPTTSSIRTKNPRSHSSARCKMMLVVFVGSLLLVWKTLWQSLASSSSSTESQYQLVASTLALLALNNHDHINKEDASNRTFWNCSTVAVQAERPLTFDSSVSSSSRTPSITTASPTTKSFQSSAPSTFSHDIESIIDWNEYEQIILQQEKEQQQRHQNEVKQLEHRLAWMHRQVFTLLYSYAILEPPIPINRTCHAPPLDPPPLSLAQCNPYPHPQSPLWSSPWSSTDNNTITNMTTFFSSYISSPSSPLTTSVSPPVSSRKIGHAVQLGFDIDTLEIHLHELCHVVDKIFILEWTHFHNPHALNRTLSLPPKPLAWDAVKLQPRFAFCLDKVVHLILDDVDTAHVRAQQANILQQMQNATATATSSKQIKQRQAAYRRRLMWLTEKYQEQARWHKILAWNEASQFFGPDDLIGLGDVDEIPSRHVLHLLKHCPWKHTAYQVDIGIWYPMGRIHQAFRTEFPVRGKQYPYSLGDPTFFVWGHAQNKTRQSLLVDSASTKSTTSSSSSSSTALSSSTVFYANRNRGKSAHSLLGGMHMSHYGYLVYQLLKRTSCTECDGQVPLPLLWSTIQKHRQQQKQNEPQRQFPSVAALAAGNAWSQLEQELSQVSSQKSGGALQKRTVPLSQLPPEERDRVVHLPWFYSCNRQRYPMWEGMSDARIATN